MKDLVIYRNVYKCAKLYNLVLQSETLKQTFNQKSYTKNTLTTY